jgi:hypothetical protein
VALPTIVSLREPSPIITDILDPVGVEAPVDNVSVALYAPGRELSDSGKFGIHYPFSLGTVSFYIHNYSVIVCFILN